MTNIKVYCIQDCSNDDKAISLVEKAKCIIVCYLYMVNLKNCISIHKGEKIEVLHDLIRGVYIYRAL